MSNVNDELRKRILDDTNDDDVRVGDTWRQALVSRFDAKRKKLVVVASVQLLMGLAIFFFGASFLGYAPDMRLMLLAVVVMLIGYETTVLIKLWYWVAETNLRVMREIKQLQLLSIGEPQASGQSPAQSQSDMSSGSLIPPSGWNRLSMRTLQWASVAVIVSTALVGTVLVLLPLGRAPATAVYEEHSRIGENGSCEVLTRDQYPYAGVTPTDSLVIRSEIALEDATWRQEGGRVLPHTVSQEGETNLYTVRFPQPVFRGEQVDLRGSVRADKLVRRQDDRWIYEATWNWNRPRKSALTIKPAVYAPTRRTVTLPANAIVESVTPKPKMQWGEYDGRSIMSFEEPTEGPAIEGIRIVYRLAANTATGLAKVH